MRVTRRLHPFWVAGLLLLVSACGRSDRAALEGRAEGTDPAALSDSGTSAAPPSRPASGRRQIVVLGDSLTAGLGLAVNESYPALLQARLDREGYAYDVVNAGVSGDTSAGGLRRLRWALDGEVDVLIVALGANDGLRGLPAAQMKRNLKTIVDTARDRGVKVVLAGMEAPPNFGPAYTVEFRQVFRDLAREPGVEVVPFLLAGVAGIPSLNQPDGIHPNEAGARVIERNVWTVLQKVVGPAGRK